MTISILRRTMATHTQQGMITPAQLRAARALLDWTRDDLAKRSGVAAVTVMASSTARPTRSKGRCKSGAARLRSAGVRFIDGDDQDGPGVRLRGAKAKR